MAHPVKSTNGTIIVENKVLHIGLKTANLFNFEITEIMGVLKSRKNKKFDYTPRYFNNNGEGSPFQIEHKFDKFRKTVGDNPSLKGKFRNAFEDLKDSSNRKTNKILFLIISVLILLFLFIIDFDLSIFLNN